MDGPRSAAEVELVVEALTHGDLEVVGQITDSSNIALLCEVQGDAVTEAAEATGAPVHVIYKPVRGERPLWDFPDGTLAGREVATFAVSRGRRLGRRPADRAPRRSVGGGVVQLWIGDPFDALDQRSAGGHLLARSVTRRVAVGDRRRGQRRPGRERHPREP